MSLIRKFVSKIRGQKSYAPSIRFAVIRPRQAFATDEFKAAVEKGMSSAEFQQRAHDATPSKYSLQPGDIFDEIEEFERALNDGDYQRVD